MSLTRRTVLTVVIGLTVTSAGAVALKPDQVADPKPWVATTLGIDGQHVPQNVFDGDSSTFFRSTDPAPVDATVTLTFSTPVAVAALAVVTGDAEGHGRLTGVLETSTDGQPFSRTASFADGLATAEPGNAPLSAIRLRATAAGTEPLVVQEITFRSTPAVPRFESPIEVVLNVQVEELRDWAAEVRILMMTWYPYLAELMRSDGFVPTRRIDLSVVDEKGIAWTSGGRVWCTKGWFTKHPDDTGALIHEEAHVLAAYPGGSPGWLVEGIADWVRWWNYEPLDHRPRIGPGGSYRDAYQRTGQFLDWLEQHRAPGTVMKLNAACRRGEYDDSLWERYTGLGVDALWDEYQAALQAK